MRLCGVYVRIEHRNKGFLLLVGGRQRWLILNAANEKKLQKYYIESEIFTQLQIAFKTYYGSSSNTFSACFTCCSTKKLNNSFRQADKVRWLHRLLGFGQRAHTTSAGN